MALGSQLLALFFMFGAGSIGAGAATGGDVHRLIKDGEIDKAQALLARRPELIESRDPKYRQAPLHIAAEGGHVGLVKYLLEHGAEVNARSHCDQTPLHLARDPAIVKLLIEHKSDLEARDVFRCTALQDAANTVGGSDHKSDLPERKIVRLLLEAGANYDIRSAVCLGDLERVRAILKKDPGEAGRERVVQLATEHNRVAIARLLLEHKADFVNADRLGTPEVYFAIPHPKMMRVYLQAGVNPRAPLKFAIVEGFDYLPNRPTTKDKLTLLHLAAQLGYVETAKVLLKAGAPVNARTARGEMPLYLAAKAGYPDVVKLLLKHKATVAGKEGARAISAAAGEIGPADREERGTGFIEQFGVPPVGEDHYVTIAERNVRYRAVIAALHDRHVPIDFFTAVALGDVERVKALLKEKPSLAGSKEGDAPDGELALHRAVQLDHKEIVALLPDAGAPIKRKDRSGWTALHSAAFWNREELAKLLIVREADLNARTNGKSTPLHVSTFRFASGVARLLLDAGADVNARDEDGRTPLSCARSRDMEKLFRDRGGKE